MKQATNRYFAFLRRLKTGGRSNMYGAIPYLAAAFSIDREEAFRIVCAWVDADAVAHAGGESPKANADAAFAASEASAVKRPRRRSDPRAKPRRRRAA